MTTDHQVTREDVLRLCIGVEAYALSKFTVWSFGYATSPAAWRKNPILNVSSWVVSEEWAARVGAALASVGLTVTGQVLAVNGGLYM